MNVVMCRTALLVSLQFSSPITRIFNLSEEVVCLVSGHCLALRLTTDHRHTYMLFHGLGRSVSRKSLPEILKVQYAMSAVCIQDQMQSFLHTDQPRPIYNIFIFLLSFTNENLWRIFRLFSTYADAGGPESLPRGPDRKKLDRLTANQNVRFARIPDQKQEFIFVPAQILNGWWPCEAVSITLNNEPQRRCFRAKFR